MRPILSIEELSEQILSGSRVALGRAITLVESTLARDAEQAQELLAHLAPYTQSGRRLGISGPPGVGKSSFIEVFGMGWVERGHRVAVLAIDPSSPIGKGSILGDKTRMERLASHPATFIRPSASGNHPGGVARSTREAILLCLAAGYDTVIVETVGVGQAETAVRNMVDMFLLLVQPGSGDELQGIKKGIIEMADLIVVTKADGSLSEKARTTALEYRNALHYYPPKSWKTDVLLCSALENKGFEEIYLQIEAYYEALGTGLLHLRQQQNMLWMHETVRTMVLDWFYAQPAVRKAINNLETKVLAGELQPHFAAKELLRTIFNSNFCSDK